MTTELERLLQATKTAKPTADEREAQRRSFAYGNTHFENEAISKDLVDEMAEALKNPHAEDRRKAG